MQQRVLYKNNTYVSWKLKLVLCDLSSFRGTRTTSDPSPHALDTVGDEDVVACCIAGRMMKISVENWK